MSFTRSSKPADGSGVSRKRHRRHEVESLECRRLLTALLVTTADDSMGHAGESLRDAIATANADAIGGTSDVITFDPNLNGDTIALKQGQLELGTNGAGSGVITIDGGNGISVTGSGTSRVLQVDSNLSAIFAGLTITGGSVSGDSSAGGIYNLGTLTVSNCTISGNSAGIAGGGIDNEGTLTVSGSTISGNSAESTGGGISGSGIITVTHSTFAGNSVAGGDGGGIFSYYMLTVSGSTFSKNSAGQGGGISALGSVTISDSTFSGNSAANNSGGGIYGGSYSTLTVSDSTFSGNKADQGGGIAINNTAMPTLFGTIAAGNTADSESDGPDVFGAPQSGSTYNLIGDGTAMTGISNGTGGNLIGTSAAPIVPGLLPLAYNAGPTETMALTASSRARNAGGPVTTLSTVADMTTTSLSVDLAAAIASTPGQYLIQVDSEQMLVTDISGNTLTVLRGYDGTIAAAHAAGASVYLATDQTGAPRAVPPDIGAFQYRPGTATKLTKNTTTSVVFGQAVTFTATVAPPVASSPPPTGMVTFENGSAVIGIAALSGGVATFSISSLAPAVYSIHAVYAGSNNYLASGSSSLQQTVRPAATDTKLTKNTSTPIQYGQSVTFTAAVTPVMPGAGTPTGVVTFKDNGATIGTGSIGQGIATFSTTSLPVGSNLITSVYGSDSNFNSSTSGGLTQTVDKAATATKLTKSSTTVLKFGQSVTFTAAVAALNPVAGTPTGTVTFVDNGATIGTGTLSGGGATFSTRSLSVGSHSITAIYGSDSNFTTSTSSAITQTVNQSATTTKLAKSTTTAVKSGTSVTFTATLAAVSPAREYRPAR